MRIAQEIEQRGRHHIYRFRIRGIRDPELTFDFDSLMTRYRIAEILDESEPQYDFQCSV